MKTDFALLPYQARWYAAGRHGDARWRWLEKSRQTGMTFTEGSRCAGLASLERSAGGKNCTYVSTSLVLAREFIGTVATWARGMQIAVTDAGLTVVRDGRDDILAHEVRFASGLTVRAASSNPAAMRGLRGEVVIDETGHHQHLDELLKAAFAVTTWGGRITCLSTHNGINNPFNKLGQDIKSGRKRGAWMRIDIHEALREGLYRRICKVERRPWSAEGEQQFLADCLASPGSAEEFEVNPSEGGAIFYRRDLLEACARDRTVCLYLQRPQEWITRDAEARAAETRAWCRQQLRPLLMGLDRKKLHVAGQDFARKRHLSAIWVLEQSPDMTLATAFWIELRNVPDEEQEIIAEYLMRGAHKGDGTPEVGITSCGCRGFAIDASEGGGRNLAERLGGRWGRREDNAAGLIVSVTLSSDWYERQHHRLRQRLEERDLSIPRNEDVLDDLQSWRVGKYGKLELGPETKSHRDGLPRHGDTSVALLLAQSLAPDVPQAPKYRTMRKVTRARWVP